MPHDVSREQLREMAIRMARESPCVMMVAMRPGNPEDVMIGMVGEAPEGLEGLAEIMATACEIAAAMIGGLGAPRLDEWRAPRAADG